jgi:PhnB protein
MSTELHPYLNFDGKTAEAMTFYADALGGTVRIMRFGDSPMPVAPEHKDRVMHATVNAGGVTFMASDTMPGHPFTQGTNMHMSLNFADTATQDAVWARLAEGATVTMPLTEQFFGRFGMLVDRFGTSWMLHYAPPQARQA